MEKAYLGKDYPQQKGNDLPIDICLTLLESTDNNFGYYKKVEKRDLEHRSFDEKEPLFSSNIFFSLSECSFTLHKAKKKKLVYILSSVHQSVAVD